jgi:predicted CoA-binding protein
LSQESQPPEEAKPIAVVSREQFPGRWANDVSLKITRHEITLDMIRVGPHERRAEVVSRVSFSPLLFMELVETINRAWKDYTETAGVPR